MTVAFLDGFLVEVFGRWVLEVFDSFYDCYARGGVAFGQLFEVAVGLFGLGLFAEGLWC